MKNIDMTSVLNLNIKEVLLNYSCDMFDGKIDKILLGLKDTIKLELEARHQSEYMNFIIINVYDVESLYSFEFSYPIMVENDENDWQSIVETYEKWRGYFENWNDDVEKELMEICGRNI